jgi:hypothetical protein
MTAADAKRELEERAASARKHAGETGDFGSRTMWLARARAYEEAASIVGTVRS